MRNFISEDDIEQAILQKLEGARSNMVFCAVTLLRTSASCCRMGLDEAARKNAYSRLFCGRPWRASIQIYPAKSWRRSPATSAGISAPRI